MNTAMKLLLGKGWIKMDEELPAEAGGGGGAPVEEEEVPAGDDLDWLLGGDEEPEPEQEPEPKQEEEEEPAQEEEEPEPEPEPKKEEEQPKPEGKKEEDKKEEEQQPEQLSDEQIQEQREQFRAELEKQFAISEEDANLLVTAPESVLPRLASNIVMQTLDKVQQMNQMIVQALPQMIQQVQSQATNEGAIKNQFMEMHPALSGMDSAELDAAVSDYAPVIKQRFPNATPEERMQKLGQLIAVTYGLQAAPAKKQKKAAEPPKPHTPAAPARSSSTPVQQQKTKLEVEIDELLNSDD